MSKQLHFFLDRIQTPIGELLALSDEHGHLRAVDWTDHEERMRRLLHRQYGAARLEFEQPRNLTPIARALADYFKGDLECLRSLPVETAGTAFQRSVWEQLRTIAPGETISYGELAKRLGQPSAVRAVGLANGANPVGIVIPCHRVIGADGSLTGYGGGLERKKWLLEHERKYVDGRRPRAMIPIASPSADPFSDAIQPCSESSRSMACRKRPSAD